MSYEQAKLACATCTKCPLSDNRMQMVWGRGDEGARFFFIGEGPGVQEDQSGTPFVGKAGHLLNEWIQEAGIPEHYITNTVKCRPLNNRAPTMTEMETCFPYLEVQLQHVKPYAIILLGRAACDLLHPEDDYGALRNIVNRQYERGGYHYLALYHPAFVLRQNKATQEDLSEDAIDALQYLVTTVLPKEE